MMPRNSLFQGMEGFYIIAVKIDYHCCFSAFVQFSSQSLQVAVADKGGQTNLNSTDAMSERMRFTCDHHQQ